MEVSIMICLLKQFKILHPKIYNWQQQKYRDVEYHNISPLTERELKSIIRHCLTNK